MEILTLLMAALAITILVGAAFSFAGYRGPWPSVVWFFALLFLGTFAIGIWSDPVGPRMYGVPWLGFLVTAILIGLLIAASTPDYRYGRRQHVKQLPLHDDVPIEPDTEPAPLNPRLSSSNESEAAATVSIFFWVFAILAIAVAVVRFLIEVS